MVQIYRVSLYRTEINELSFGEKRAFIKVKSVLMSISPSWLCESISQMEMLHSGTPLMIMNFFPSLEMLSLTIYKIEGFLIVATNFLLGN